MNGPDMEHRDVASYALGVLDDADATRFEMHLVSCAACTVELESLLPVTSLLADVDGDSFVGTEESLRDERMLGEMINAVSYERSRLRARRMLTVAAGIVAVLLAGGLTLILGTGFATGLRPNEAFRPSVAPTQNPYGGQSAPGTGNSGGSGGQYESTNKKLVGKVNLVGNDSGTQISLRLTGLEGPRRCRLVAFDKDGLGEVLRTWPVPKRGYGTDANPDPLIVLDGTEMDRSSIERLEVQSVGDGEDGKGRRLLGIPVPIKR